LCLFLHFPHKVSCLSLNRRGENIFNTNIQYSTHGPSSIHPWWWIFFRYPPLGSLLGQLLFIFLIVFLKFLFNYLLKFFSFLNSSCHFRLRSKLLFFKLNPPQRYGLFLASFTDSAKGTEQWAYLDKNQFVMHWLRKTFAFRMHCLVIIKE